jgi:hypothetical protein
MAHVLSSLDVLHPLTHLCSFTSRPLRFRRYFGAFCQQVGVSATGAACGDTSFDEKLAITKTARTLKRGWREVAAALPSGSWGG